MIAFKKFWIFSCEISWNNTYSDWAVKWLSLISIRSAQVGNNLQFPMGEILPRRHQEHRPPKYSAHLPHSTYWWALRHPAHCRWRSRTGSQHTAGCSSSPRTALCPAPGCPSSVANTHTALHTSLHEAQHGGKRGITPNAIWMIDCYYKIRFLRKIGSKILQVAIRKLMPRTSTAHCKQCASLVNSFQQLCVGTLHCHRYVWRKQIIID